jgi:hypothetical protein
MDLRRRNFIAPQGLLKNQRGFAYVFFLSFLPLLLAGFLLILFSQFFLKNWMQSLHICRTELFTAQKRTGKKLTELINLNSMAKSLRMALAEAEAELAMATATENAPLAAKANADILRIKKQQLQLDRLQKSTIMMANLEMTKGLEKVAREIRQQSSALQPRLPDLFSYQIHSIRFAPKALAVQPDQPDVAPVYELKKDFKEEQSLHISWISEFRTQHAEKYKWILNRHQKPDSCSASLEEKNGKFQEMLMADKSFLKL